MSEDLSPSAGAEPDAEWTAFARFVAGESDPAETARVEQWLLTQPEAATVAAAVRVHAANADSKAQVQVDTERALAAVRGRMADSPTLRVERGGAKTMRKAPWQRPLLAMAAGLIAVVGVVQWRGRSGAEAKVYATAVGQRDSVQLVDGSTVVLAPGSRLTVAAGFSAAHRVVVLDGAAFFDVRHDGAHPFVVQARDAEIRDIGTAFSVKTDINGQITVAVTHGIVALRDTSKAAAAPVELKAGDRGVLRSGAVAVTRGTVTDADMAWTRGQLAYRDAPLAEVRADLRRWYGIDLRITDSVLAGRTLTASFSSDSSARVIELIALALGANVVQRGDSIFLQPQGPGPGPTP